jgi:hypothetical protein
MHSLCAAQQLVTTRCSRLASAREVRHRWRLR